MVLYKITLFDETGESIFSYDCLHLPFKEEWILKKSMLEFNDPEPCIIHKSASIKLLGKDVSNLFQKCLSNSEKIKFLSWHDTPIQIRDMLDINYLPYKIKIEFA